MRDPRELSQSYMDPQTVPADHCYTVLQDHGVNDGGWGPAALLLPWLPGGARPIVYTGSAAHVIEALTQACRMLAQETGKPTRLVCFTQREDVATFGGSS